MERKRQLEMSMKTKDVNEVLRQDVLASDRLGDYFYALLKEKIDEAAADIKEFMADFVIRHSKASELVDELDLLEHIRVCSECGKPMTEGFCIEDGAEYYCSEECLHKNLTEEEYENLYDEGRGNSYYTSWID
jgi:hypothetical protein